ncbi:hypothetical protein N0V83_008669 [Neocucurbitaria cava]|uniref:Uncharacterized protein n=1 Tax=Neocucurbitaria cava TaxID=798079 RepID=A0A9W8Y2I7_9PLEO|nr:hypothetical protein N0V83_008669 [Neocucurbitaria cava]
MASKSILETKQDRLNTKFLEVLDNHETEVFKQSREDLDRTDPPLEPLRISSNQSALAGKVVENSSYAAGISEKNRITLKRPNPERPERTEVPNTPTQHSSQLVIPDSAPEDQPQYSVGAGFGTVSPLTKSSQSGSIASSTVLCSVCRKQRIFTKNNSDNVICRNCRNRSLIVAAGKLEIPETPDATPACEAYAEGASATTPSTPGITPKLASTHWFESKLVSSKPSIVKKKVRGGEMTCVSNQPPDPPIESAFIADMPQIADSTEQLFVSKADPGMRSDPSRIDMPVEQISTSSEEARHTIKDTEPSPFTTTKDDLKCNERASSVQAGEPSQDIDQVLKGPVKASQIAPLEVNACSNMHMSASKIPVTSMTERHHELLYMPFERSTLREPQSMLNSNHNIKRETSFYKVFPQEQRLSFEALKPLEKAQKIAEIKARPTRKTLFGSDHRLAHVRRFGRRDIHDESVGAWIPKCSAGTQFALGLDKVVLPADNDEFESLREVFDLPQDAIPMNDGQTELAFRDGTLINGRLPRPRQIYKVGKLFGGELTIRTS